MKIKLTKGELKKQRDALAQYERFLPTLQLKKQQLQMEILHQVSIFEEKNRDKELKIKAAENWSGLLTDSVNMRQWIMPKDIIATSRNVAGVDLPLFERIEFPPLDYDFFITPLWVDAGIEALRKIVSLQEEIEVIQKSIRILKEELRITTQRVNLFEKVKIPEAEEAIRIIKIYLGDQMTNAVGRSKIAKKKLEENILEEALV
jgi:V/A-type H+-transporting ATPase subunit D